MPTRLNEEDSHITPAVRKFQQALLKWFPDQKIILWDEKFTSRMAFQAMIDAGVPKKKRRQKGLIDQVSATIILQEYLDSQ